MLVDAMRERDQKPAVYLSLICHLFFVQPEPPIHPIWSVQRRQLSGLTSVDAILNIEYCSCESAADAASCSHSSLASFDSNGPNRLSFSTAAADGRAVMVADAGIA
jgi:hypothetical protein